MKLAISPLVGMGLLIFVVLMVVERLITPVSDSLAIPLLLPAIVLIIGVALEQGENNRTDYLPICRRVSIGRGCSRARQLRDISTFGRFPWNSVEVIIVLGY